MQSVAEIAKIKDTPARLKAAAQLVREADTESEVLACRRNNLMLVLLRVHNRTKMEIIRAAGVSRTFLVGKPVTADPNRKPKPRKASPGGLLCREPSLIPEIEGAPEDMLNELEVIRERLIELRDIAAAARPVRNDAVIELLFAEEDPWPNHRVSEVSGLDSARVAQLRVGALKAEPWLVSA